jgi:hypothetical protein
VAPLDEAIAETPPSEGGAIEYTEPSYSSTPVETTSTYSAPSSSSSAGGSSGASSSGSAAGEFGP